MKTGLRRPGLEPGPITTAVNVASGWSRYPANNKHWWLWVPAPRAQLRTSRSLQSICKDMNFVIRFGRIGCGGGNHGCEGHFGKEVCCAAER
jgi:hypothetical protein